MMQEDNQKEKNQEQESWSEHFFAEMKMMRIMQEKRKMKKNGQVLTVLIWSKKGRKQK